MKIVQRFVHYVEFGTKQDRQPVLLGASVIMPSEDGTTVLGSSVKDENDLRTIKLAIGVMKETGVKVITLNGLETRVANWLEGSTWK
jgi:hypothetical protein